MRLAPTNLQVIGDELAIVWNDGQESYLKLETLRRHCPCAGCGGEPDILGHVVRSRRSRTRRPASACAAINSWAATPGSRLGRMAMGPAFSVSISCGGWLPSPAHRTHERARQDHAADVLLRHLRDGGGCYGVVAGAGGCECEAGGLVRRRGAAVGGFRGGNFTHAYEYASQAIQARYSEEQFAAMVQTRYPGMTRCQPRRVWPGAAPTAATRPCRFT